MSKQHKTKEAKKQCIELLKRNACSFSAAANKLGVSRRTVNRWYADDQDFQAEVDDVRESLLDFAESKLVENIAAGKEQSVMFMLKTKGKTRGYVERSELAHSGAIDGISAININIVHAQQPSSL